ncbi:MAG: hypothetical protein ACI898_000726, partial [Flavobacteriales bacterium]
PTEDGEEAISVDLLSKLRKVVEDLRYNQTA